MDEGRDRITRALSSPGEEEHPDIEELLRVKAAPDSNGGKPPAAEPGVIIFEHPVVLEGPPQQGGRSFSGRERMSSCYVSRSCPTCAPCCLAVFLAPLAYLVWTIYPNWKHGRELRNVPLPAEPVAAPDPASDLLKSEVKAMQFASRSAVERFMEERGIIYEIRSDGYWIAHDRSQQEAVVILQQRWLALPLEPAEDSGESGE